jgi:hypothetical protein
MQPALLPSPGRPVRFFDPYGAATGRLELGQPCLIGTTTERAALFGPFRLLPAQQLRPEGLSAHGERPDRGRPSFETRLRRSSG